MGSREDAVVFYVDGASTQTIVDASMAVTALDADPLVVGVYLPENASYLDGAIDDLRIYDRALGASEVAALAAR